MLKHFLKIDENLVDAVDYDMRSALHLACAEGHMEMVELLVQMGAKTSVKDRWGNEPLQEAMLHGHVDVVDFLIKHGVILSLESQTALEFKMCTLASQGDMKRIKLLVQCGVAVNSADYDNRSALHLSSACGHTDIVEYLICCKADVNFKDRWGGTAMTDAVRGGHLGVQKVLSKAENYGKAESESGDTPGRHLSPFDRKAIKNSFLEAAAVGDVAEVRLCLAKGAHADDCDYDNRSALHLACSEGKLPVVTLLIGMQAQVDVVDRWGNVPLQDAMRQGHRDIVDVLTQAGARLSRESAAEMELKACTLALKGNLQGLSNLIECGVNVNAVDRDGRSPLHLAAAGGHLEAVDYLILKSADINMQDLKGDSPMGLAMMGGHASVMHVLERAGAVVPRERRASVLELRAGTSLLQAYYVSRERRAGTALLEAFPPTIAEAMMAGRALEPISKECVSVFFSDIVGFTTISSKIPASKVSNMLNRVFARFDRLATIHGVQKVDIIGDAYLAATNFLVDQVVPPRAARHSLCRRPRSKSGAPFFFSYV